MMQKIITIDIQSGIATLTLCRAEKHNALNKALVAQFLEHLLWIEKNNDVRVVILQAIGKSFCSGADLNWFRTDTDTAVQDLKILMQTLNQLSKPTIALIQGNVYGGGLGLIACCDIAISSTEVQFCFPEVKLGLVPAIIAPFCIAAMGQRAAQYYFLTAQSFDASEAYRLGLIQEITRQENLYIKGQALAHTLLANNTVAMAMTKRLVKKASEELFT